MSASVFVPVYFCVCLSRRRCDTYGFVLLKMKNALPSGIGVIFSFLTSSEICGRGPAGTSGSSSSSSVTRHNDQDKYAKKNPSSMCNRMIVLYLRYPSHPPLQPEGKKATLFYPATNTKTHKTQKHA